MKENRWIHCNNRAMNNKERNFMRAIVAGCALFWGSIFAYLIYIA